MHTKILSHIAQTYKLNGLTIRTRYYLIEVLLYRAIIILIKSVLKLYL